MKKLSSTIEEMTNEINRLKQEINDLILNLPDNPKITRLNHSCFTINSSDLSKDLVLSPLYYDFKNQYQKIVDIINETEIHEVVKQLEKLLTPNQSGSYWIKYKGIRYRFNPKVIENIKSIIT